MVEKASQRRYADDAGDFVAGCAQTVCGARLAELQVVGELLAEELGGLVEIVDAGTGVERRLSSVLAAGQQQRVDVLERRGSLVPMGDGERADDAAVEQVAGGLHDLALVDVQQRLDDAVGDRGGLRCEGLVAVHAQRGHPECRPAEVKEPDALAAVGWSELQRQVRELGLRVKDDDGGVGVADVIEVHAQLDAGLARALPADHQGALRAVGVGDAHGRVGCPQDWQHRSTRRATSR